MSTPDSSKKSKPYLGTYVKPRDHRRINQIIHELILSKGENDWLHPIMRCKLTTTVVKKLATDHKWYKALVDLPDPASHPLWQSLFGYITKEWGPKTPTVSQGSHEIDQLSEPVTENQQPEENAHTPDASNSENQSKHVSFEGTSPGKEHAKRVTRSKAAQASN